MLLRLRDTSAEAKRELDETVKVCRLNRVAGRCLKRTATPPRGVPWRTVAGNAAIHRDDVIMYYAPKIFELAGYTNTTGKCGGQ